MGGLIILFLLELAGSLCIGAYEVKLSTIGRILWALLSPWPMPTAPSWSETEQVVVVTVRLPRVLEACCAGIGLGLAGVTLQAMMRNPLVGPDLVGVTSGAAFGGVLAMLFDQPSLVVVLSACAGGITALTVSAFLASRMSSNSLSIMLTGIFVGAFFAALLGLLEYLADPETQLPGMVYWLLGSFAAADRQKALVMAIPTFLGAAILFRMRWRLNLLSLGETDAMSLGVDVGRTRWVLVVLVSLMVAAQVSVSGGIAWIGILIPHAARMAIGPDHRKLVPAAAITGGMLMLGVDDLARVLSEREIPIGIITAVIGTPILCYLFLRARGRGWHLE